MILHYLNAVKTCNNFQLIFFCIFMFSLKFSVWIKTQLNSPVQISEKSQLSKIENCSDIYLLISPVLICKKDFDPICLLIVLLLYFSGNRYTLSKRLLKAMVSWRNGHLFQKGDIFPYRNYSNEIENMYNVHLFENHAAGFYQKLYTYYKLLASLGFMFPKKFNRSEEVV